MPRPNDADPFLGCLPANTKVEALVAAFSATPQRVTVIVPGVGEHTFQGQADEDGQPKQIGGSFKFTTPVAQVQAECWNEQELGGTWYNYEFVAHQGNPNTYELPFGMKGVGSVLFFAVDTTPVPEPPPIGANAELKENILWMWNDTGLCWKPQCVFHLVEWKVGIEYNNGSFGPIFPFTFRGVKSAKGCVETAKEELAKGNRAMAIAWLQAGQLHNQTAQAVIAKNADAALAFIATL